jgi:inner membrane protein
MASLGHVAVGMAAGRLWTMGAPPGAAGRGLATLARAMVAFGALSLAPDLDVIAFRFGIPYAAPFGHRGAAHSLCVAVALAVVAAAAMRLAPDQVEAGQTRFRLWLLCAAVAVSHGLLDTLTDGGLGIALLWPFSNERYFAPWTPIPVAPIGARMFITARGLRVATIEALQFAPLLVWAVWPRRRPGYPS